MRGETGRGGRHQSRDDAELDASGGGGGGRSELMRIEKQVVAAGEGVVRRDGVGGNEDRKVDNGDSCMEAEEGFAIVSGNDWVQ